MKNCLNCGKEITKRKNKNYCSSSCYFSKRDITGSNNPRYRKRLSEQTRHLISLANRGKTKWIPRMYLKGIPLTKEHKQKISIGTSKALLKPGMKIKLQTRLGKHHTIESKEKSRISNTGLKRSKEFCINMSRISIGRPSAFKGHTHTPENKKKQSERAIQRQLTPDFKSISKPEKITWGILNDLGFKQVKRYEEHDSHEINYIHHYRFSDIKHAYVADFVFPELNIVIEEDGIYHHIKKPGQVELDKVRTTEMIDKGFEVLRITDKELLNNYNITKNKISSFIANKEFNKIINMQRLV